MANIPPLFKNKRTVLKRILQLGCVVVLGCAIIYFPVFSHKAGDVFFGRIPALYNVKIAQLFFKQSAYPLFGTSEPYAHYQLSRTYFIQGKLDKALEEAKKELSFYPDHVRAHYVLGLTYGYMNEEEQAIKHFETFIASHPASWAARNDKAWLEFRIGDIDSALATIEPVSIALANPWVQNTYGTMLMNKGRYDEAYEAFTRAQNAASSMSEEVWGHAYPGNDPRIYAVGLSAMKASIAENLALLEKKWKGKTAR